MSTTLEQKLTQLKLGRMREVVASWITQAEQQQLGYQVRFLTAQQFANAVLATASRAELAGVLRPLVRCDLLILDEFGYLPVEPQIGPALYELISERYTHSATVITSNKSLASWGEVV